MLHHLPLLASLAVAMLIVYHMPDTLVALVLSIPIILTGYLAGALIKIRREGVLTDEREEHISLRARATAFDATLVTAGILAITRSIISRIQGEPLKILDNMALLVLLALIYYALAHAIYSRKYT